MKTNDLFENPELLPDQIKLILDNYELDCMTYSDCKKMLSEMEILGYTFEFGLDSVPYNLRQID
jgi:hypothetical protein